MQGPAREQQWLAFYNQLSPNITRNEEKTYADQAQEHPDGRSPQTKEP